MAKDWGIKIIKPGEDIATTDPSKMLLSSKYQMFKYHNEYITTSVFAPGDKDHTVSITHGLGYVPAFLPFVSRSTNNKLYMIPGVETISNRWNATECYADTDKIYFRTQYGLGGNLEGWNEKKYFLSDKWSTWFSSNASYALGRHDGGTTTNMAIRFSNIVLSSGDSLNRATLGLYVGSNNSTPSGRIKWKTYGIDEDNTGSFGGDPMGRSRTSAETSSDIQTTAEAQVGQSPEVTVTDQVNEIKARGGWSSGNAIGFHCIENSGDSDNYLYHSGGSGFLTLRFNGNITYTYKVIVFKEKLGT